MGIEPIPCKWCAGIDTDGIPINCIVCSTNPKFIDRRKEYNIKMGGV